MIDTRLRIAEMTASHYQSSEEFQLEQANRLADLVQRFIDYHGIKPGGDPSEGWFRSVYSLADIRRRLDNPKS